MNREQRFCSKKESNDTKFGADEEMSHPETQTFDRSEAFLPGTISMSPKGFLGLSTASCGFPRTRRLIMLEVWWKLVAFMVTVTGTVRCGKIQN